VNRWKLISLVLAGCMTYSWWSGDARSQIKSTGAQARSSSGLGGLIQGRSVATMSADEVVRQLFAAKDVEDIRTLAERLGAIGDNDAIEAVIPLLQDPRSGVPEAIAMALGMIATDHAVDVLIKTASDPRAELRIAAVDALAVTKNRRAESTLIEIAQRSGDAAQDSAISALGEIGSDKAIELLVEIAGHPTDTGTSALSTLGRMESRKAKDAVIALVDSPNLSVAAAAISELDDIDAAMIEKLTAIVASGESDLVTSAVRAIARAGEPGLPALRVIALEGPLETRMTAIGELSAIDSPVALATLRTILENEDGRAADGAASALAAMNNDEAREALISAALSDKAGTTRVVDYLMRQTGPEVEQALLVIAKSDSNQRWEAAEHLLRAGNADALALAVAHARGGSDSAVQLEAMQALADANTQPAIDALVQLVRSSGSLKPKALAILGDARPDDAVVAKLLHESVQSSNHEEAAAAAAALAAVGTVDARDALIAALRSSDAAVALNAAESLAKFRLTDEVTAALRAAVVRHPAMRTTVMQQLLGAGSPLGLELAKQALAEGYSHDTYRVVSALERAGTAAAFDVLAHTARTATDAQLRNEVIGSLGTTGDKRASDVLGQLLRDADPSVRGIAAHALGSVGTLQARGLLIGMSRSAAPDDRRMAAATLRRFEDPDSTRRLIELVRDPDASVAYTAIDGVSGRTEAVSALRALVLDANASHSSRRNAASALSSRGHTDPAIDELLASYERYDDYDEAN
jgi:HEAT repeat protein